MQALDAGVEAQARMQALIYQGQQMTVMAGTCEAKALMRALKAQAQAQRTTLAASRKERKEQRKNQRRLARSHR